MRIALHAVGRLKAGPERALLDDYLSRAGRTARPLGVRDVDEVHTDAGKTPQDDWAKQSAKLPQGARLIRFDEDGKALSSAAFAKLIENARDTGVSDLCFLIGGADGFVAEARNAAPEALSFGKMSWPHMLARVMAAEQIYRALSILSGSPYHREGKVD